MRLYWQKPPPALAAELSVQYAAWLSVGFHPCAVGGKSGVECGSPLTGSAVALTKLP